MVGPLLRVLIFRPRPVCAYWRGEEFGGKLPVENVTFDDVADGPFALTGAGGDSEIGCRTCVTGIGVCIGALVVIVVVVCATDCA